MVLPLLVWVLGCGDAGAPDDGPGSATTNPTTGGGDGDVDATCPQASDGLGHEGEPCDHNLDCVSDFCEIFQDAPKDPDATCGEMTPGDRMRFTGRVLDFETREPIGGARLSFVSAATFPGSVGTQSGFASTYSDPGGRYDATSTGGVAAPIAVFAGVEAPEHFVTGTEIATPLFETQTYDSGADWHDAWAVSTAMVEAWSASLEQEITLAPYLPLAEKGAIVGFARRQSDGEPVAGITIVHSGPTAIQLYLTAEGTFTANPTIGTGYFVILNAELGELVGAVSTDGDPSCRAHTAAVGPNAVTVMAFEMPG